MLRDLFDLPLFDRTYNSTGTPGADRSHLLALWVGSSATKWKWAVAQLLEGVDRYAERRLGCRRPNREDISHMASNLDALSLLAGFNPGVTADTWNNRPTCTLRFAEVLAKIRASDFCVEELLYLFNGD